MQNIDQIPWKQTGNKIFSQKIRVQAASYTESVGVKHYATINSYYYKKVNFIELLTNFIEDMLTENSLN